MFDMFRDEEDVIYEQGESDGAAAFHADELQDIYEEGYHAGYSVVVGDPEDEE